MDFMRIFREKIIGFSAAAGGLISCQNGEFCRKKYYQKLRKVKGSLQEIEDVTEGMPAAKAAARPKKKRRRRKR